jgi:DnaJ-class molecular chaperone
MFHPFCIDYYSVLDLDRNATSEEIEHAYRKTLRSTRKWSVLLGRSASRVEKAYAVLINPELREQYNRYHAHHVENAVFPPM